MPVSFNVAPHAANPVSTPPGVTPRKLLAGACPPQFRSAGRIKSTSFSANAGNYDPPLHVYAPPKAPAAAKAKRSRLSRLFSMKKPVEPSIVSSESDDKVQVSGPQLFVPPAEQVSDIPGGSLPKNVATPGELLIKNVIPKPNGFVDTIISAYNQHHALVLRPDDVWLAILTQFNFYVNANAELLRANFVAHDGKKELVVMTDAFDDFGRLAREMVDLIEKNVVDPSLRAWALPDFTTTTENDTTVSAIVLMATLKAYLEYVYCTICCGIPRVTLEGEKRDWEKILTRLEKLKEYGLETTAWYHLLVPVILRFVAAFDDPNSQSNIDFWQNVAHFEQGGSGPDYYSGWITAFCVFSNRGRWLGPLLNTDIQSAVAPDSLSAERFWALYGGHAAGLVLDGTRFHIIDADNVPPSYAEVEVTLLQLETGVEQECIMTAGLVGTRVCSSKDPRLSESGQDDTVRPVVGWWLYNKN
ncbi:hypothetical protein B0H17DRAFT_1171476 [Mycena rosella]|uniref:DUF4419 domain-containing protein n=1 Tax=Mycena rosella TaxID=1033263 RepID=A0AAD7CUZ3_MYCRO|nr:hypothetical protein B0H17DRAFT_1171476 [Mycena rosella]